MALKSFKSLIGVILGAVLFTATTAQSGYEDLFAATKSASWAVYQRSTNGMSAICSAGAYKSTAEKTYMVSAGHCFVGSDLNRTDFLVTQDHKTFVKARIYRSGLEPKRGADETSQDLNKFSGNDWAIIEASVGNTPVLPIGNSDSLVLGEDLVIVGVPFGLDFLAVQGIVGSKDLALSTTVWNHYMGANVFIAGGNSGSAVISAKQRAIVGIIVAGPGSQSSLAIFMPINLVDVAMR